jgi:hypothetical protein
MCVCEFLHCTLSELHERIKNPADYMTILAYLSEQGDRINGAGSGAPDVSGGSFKHPPSTPRRRR